VPHKFLVHRQGDHVGVATEDIAEGERVEGVTLDGETTYEVTARAAVPLGHKVAVAAVEPGGTVLKYGIPIGRTETGFEVGDYVHTHNLRSARW